MVMVAVMIPLDFDWNTKIRRESIILIRFFQVKEKKNFQV